MLKSKFAANQSQSTPVLLCHSTMAMVHAQSAATFELPLTRPSLSQCTLKTLDVDQPPGVRLAICKQVVPAGRARDAAILSFIAEYSAEPGRTKPAAVDGCRHLSLKVRPLSLLSHKPGLLTLWTTMLKYAEIKICSQSITKHACFALSQHHGHGPCSICCDIRAASDKTFLVLTHFENSGCRSTSWCTVGNLQGSCPCKQSERRSNLIIHRRISC